MEQAAKALDTSGIIGAREGLARRLAAIDKAETARQEANERRRLVAARASAEAALARAKTPEERSSATRDIRDAKAALAEFRIAAVVEAKRVAIGVRTSFLDGIVDGVEQATSSASSALSDIGARIGEAIDRGLQAKLAGLASTLKATLASIADSPEARRAGSLGDEITAARAAREARDVGRQRGELGKAVTDAGGVVARRQASLAAARTASERAAAQALLDKALADQATASTSLADFEEDQRIAGLERERAALETGLQARRDAAQTAYDDQVAAAQALADAERAASARALADLDEQFRAGEVNRRQFNKRLAAIVGDPALAEDLERSGRELGLSFSRGLSRAIGSAESAAEGMARAVARYLKLNSPAETGPLAHDFRRSGRRLVNDFAAGALSARSNLTRSMAGVASAAVIGSGQRAVAAQMAAVGVGGVGAGDTYNIEIPAERPVESPREVASRLRYELRHGGTR